MKHSQDEDGREGGVGGWPANHSAVFGGRHGRRLSYTLSLVRRRARTKGWATVGVCAKAK